MNDFLKKEKKYLIVLFGLILISLFFSLIKLNNLILLTLSISANIFLLFIIKLVIEKFKIEFTKKEKIIILTEITIIILLYLYSILSRRFIYYWDFSCYYNLQLDLIQSFNNGFISGIRTFVGSTWSGEYGCFLNFFPQTIFHFTSKSINSYLISLVFTFIPYIIISYSILIKCIIKLFKLKQKNIFLLFLSLLVFIPNLHVSLIYGQPDVFGIVFIFLILSLIIDYNFKTIEYDRLILLLILTFFLTITRRWYIYWILSFYLCYVITILFNNKKDLKIITKNILKYLIIVIIVYIVTLYPFIKNILVNNYSNSYSFYSNGGFLSEISSQIYHLGYLLFIIIIGGLIYGIKEKQFRKYSFIMVLTNLLIIILFTKIQSMGLHHSILLIPTYLYSIIMIIICSLNNKKVISKVLIITIYIVLLSNTVFSYIKIKSKLFNDINIKVEEEVNYNELKKVVNWLEKNLDENNTAYMITHNNMFNPDKLRNFNTPISNVKKYLPYGSAVIGIHKFPTELFSAKYIITTTPFESISIEYKYNDVLKELIEEEVFKEIKSFNMKENYKILIYERVKPVTEEEKEKYLETLKEESKTYKDLYEKIIKDYK